MQNIPAPDHWPWSKPHYCLFIPFVFLFYKQHKLNATLFSTEKVHRRPKQAHFQIISKNCHWGKPFPRRRILNSVRGNAKLWPWREISPCTSKCRGAEQLKSNVAKKGESGWTASWTRATDMPSQKGRAQASLVPFGDQRHWSLHPWKYQKPTGHSTRKLGTSPLLVNPVGSHGMDSWSPEAPFHIKYSRILWFYKKLKIFSKQDLTR